MALEYRLAARMIMRPDFAEGVRAVLVDKDNAPRWDPAAPEGVTDEMLDAIFAPLPTGEEWTPFPASPSSFPRKREPSRLLRRRNGDGVPAFAGMTRWARLTRRKEFLPAARVAVNAPPVGNCRPCNG